MLLAAAVFVAAALIVLRVRRGDPLTGAARRQWRDGAVLRINQRVAEEQRLAGQVDRLKALASGPGPGRWAGDSVLVMRNGEWIVCESICRKENDRIHDLFLGKASDGRWYYSTFHFCIDRLVLRGQHQPDSVADFARAYWLAPFDGRSDECLKHTWTGGPWGDEMLPAATQPAVAGSP